MGRQYSLSSKAKCNGTGHATQMTVPTSHRASLLASTYCMTSSVLPQTREAQQEPAADAGNGRYRPAAEYLPRCVVLGDITDQDARKCRGAVPAQEAQGITHGSATVGISAPWA